VDGQLREAPFDSAPDYAHIASLLKQAREEADLSLAAVATRCGLDRAAISRLENGLYENTTLTTLNRLARAYGKRFLVQLVNDDSEVYWH
jgi:transcriptional regulator with XRE-family HTH domain